MSGHNNPESIRAYLALGSNLGDRHATLNSAIDAINKLALTSVVACSSFHETVPVGPIKQGKFINAAIAVNTTLSPLALLQGCQKIEQAYGRERHTRWGPRTLDIDILTYGKLILNTPELTLPHPEMHKRDFVLIPLREIQ